MLSYSPYDDAPPHVIRVMTPADLKMVCQIDRDAFDTYRQQQRRSVTPLRLRTPEHMNAAIRRRYPGVVIESPPGRVVGYCFTHVWGSLGWLGTLGVAPRNQGFGLGRAVIAAGLDLLRQAGCTTLALETMPESGKNLAVYTRLELDAEYMTLVCQGAPQAAPTTHFTLWDGRTALRDIASKLVPGLDPTPAARWLHNEESGKTLVWHEDGRPVAFATLRHMARRLEGMQMYLTAEAAMCLPEAAPHWPRYLSEMEAYAQSLGRAGLSLPVNARQTVLLRAMLDAGLEIVHTRVRMMRGDPIGTPDAILMITMAM